MMATGSDKVVPTIGPDGFRQAIEKGASQRHSEPSGGGGGVDELTRRAGVLEGDVRDIRKDVGQLRVNVSAIERDLVHKADKADLERVEGSLKADLERVEGSLKADLERVEGALKVEIQGVRTEVRAIERDLIHKADKADLERVEGHLKTEIQGVRSEVHAVKASIIQWMVGVMLASASLSAVIALGIARIWPPGH